jgi:hypothetical protein
MEKARILWLHEEFKGRIAWSHQFLPLLQVLGVVVLSSRQCSFSVVRAAVP